MTHEGSLPHSQKLATSPGSESDQSSPWPPPTSLKIHFNIILPYTPRSPKWSLCLSYPHQNPVYTLPVHLTVLICSPEQYMMSSTDHKALRYVVFSCPLLPCPSYAKISSSASYSRTYLAYVSPSVWETKFHTHTKQQENYSWVYLFNLYING